MQWSLYGMHRRKDFYGEDAEEFKPERWTTLRPGWVRSLNSRNNQETANRRDRNIYPSTADPESALANNSPSQKPATPPSV